MNINDYIGKQYEDGARGPDKHDCWSLVRTIRHAMGYPLLPSFGNIRHTMPKEFTTACRSIARGMIAGEPKIGSIAAVFRGKICIHVALVVEIEDKLAVIEINPDTNCRWLRLPEFEKRCLKVIYYHD